MVYFSLLLSMADFDLHAFASFTFSFFPTSYSSTSYLLFTFFPFLLFFRRTRSISHAPFAPNIQQIKKYRLC